MLPKLDRYILNNVIESIEDGHLKRLAIAKYHKIVPSMDIVLLTLSLENTGELRKTLQENNFDFQEIIDKRKKINEENNEKEYKPLFNKIKLPPKRYYVPLNFIQSATISETIIDALKHDASLFKWLSKEEQNNYDYALCAIDKDPFILEIVSDELKNNYDLVYNAVNKQGLSLEYASITLRDNDDIVTCAIKNNFRSFNFASDRIKNNISFIKKLVISYMEKKTIKLEEQALHNLNIFIELYSKNLFNDEIELVLKELLSPNMINLFNMEERNFKLILALFDNTQKITERNMGNIKETIIQKEFSINNDYVLNKFSNIFNLLKNNNHEQLSQEFVEIKKYINIDKFLNKNKLTFHQFLVQLLQDDQNTITLLHTIINSYIDKKREEYLKKRLVNADNELLLEKVYNKNYLIKRLLSNDINTIIKLIESINIDNLEYDLIQFIKNKKILQECIMYRQNNNMLLTSDIKKNLYLLNKVFDNLYTNGLLDQLAFDDNSPQYSSKIPEVSNLHILNIMNQLDYEKLENNLLNNSDLYSKLSMFLKNYQLIAWQNIFDNMLQKADMYVDETTVADFINYFYQFYPLIEKDINSGLIKDVRLTRLLEEASSYNSYLSKTRILIGSENHRLISVNPAPNKANAKKIERFEKVPFLVKGMYKRQYISVPPIHETININGKNITVSLGNFTDPLNLTLGERTGSCMRIKGQGDTLLDFCSIDPNGFHIIFKNESSGLISRVSGFRNGNTVFLNQLRESLDKNITNQNLRDLIYKVADMLIEKSKDSSYPIENVLISNALVMNQEKLVSIDGLINFKQNLVYNIDDYEEEFYSDIKTTNSVLLNKDQVLKPIKLSTKTVQYECFRSPVMLAVNTNNITNIINRLHLLNDFLNGQNYEEIEIIKPTLTNIESIIYGEDWYITINDEQEIIDKFTFDEPHRKEKAMQEMEEVIRTNNIKESKKSNFKLT